MLNLERIARLRRAGDEAMYETYPKEFARILDAAEAGIKLRAFVKANFIHSQLANRPIVVTKRHKPLTDEELDAILANNASDTNATEGDEAWAKLVAIAKAKGEVRLSHCDAAGWIEYGVYWYDDRIDGQIDQRLEEAATPEAAVAALFEKLEVRDEGN